MGCEQAGRNRNGSRLCAVRCAGIRRFRLRNADERRLRRVCFAAAPVGLLALAALSGCKPDNKYVEPPAPTVNVARPEARNVTRYYETSGTLSSVNQADLVARV